MPTIDPRTGEIREDAEPRLFSELLPELSAGATDLELGHALRQLLAAVQDTGKAGRLTLTLDVAFNGQAQIKVKDAVTVKLPEHDRQVTNFFIDKNGNASRRDPNQPEIPGVTQLRKDNHA